MGDRILLVTGRQAAGSLASIYKNVHVCPVDVAALLSLNRIHQELSKIDLSCYSLILVPGLVSGDTRVLAKKLGIPVFKGTKHSSDLPMLLENLNDITLSTKHPADFELEDKARQLAERSLKGAYSSKKNFLMKIGRKNAICISKQSPMHLIAEIADAPRMSKAGLVRQARYYAKSGASVIDIGMVSGEDNSSKVREIVKTVRSVVSLPVSIDSMNECEISEACKAGVDLVLSVGEINIDIAKEIDVPFVLVPVDKKGKLPVKAEDRVDILGRLLKRLKGCPVILDPVLSPLHHGFIESIRAYELLRERHPRMPLMMGAGNVTELLDADSPGINALIAGIASEIGVQLLFTVEASSKTVGSVSELSTAAKMMFLSKNLGRSPKDVGFNLLRLKDKRRLEVVEDSNALKLKEVSCKIVPERLEPNFYRIYLKNDKIVAVGYASGKPRSKFIGTSAEAICKKICSTERIGSEHAAYLGRELVKAEIALVLGKNYVQDEKIF